MAFVHGKGAVVNIDDSAGTPRDLSAYITSSDFEITAETAETTAYGKSAKTFIVGLKDGKVSFNGNWDVTATTGPDAVLSGLIGVGPLTVDWRPAGSASTNVKYTGEAICTSYKASAPVGGIVTFSASFQFSDTVTRTVL